MNYQFADLHCHPNLKTFGHSYNLEARTASDKSHVWYKKNPTATSKLLNTLTGLTKFSQADFTTMSKANVKIAFVSLYPFEKGFFINGQLNGPISAQLANLVTSVSYSRVRHIQKHTDYFNDLLDEYNFLMNSCDSYQVDGIDRKWTMTSNWGDIQKIMKRENEMAVITTIEGAHVLNTGLELYGKKVDEEQVLTNLQQIKEWEHPPLFITFAHNFNNDLCGHARSLDPLGPLVNQNKNLNKGFSKLGLRVLRSMLSRNPRCIYIDIKHMSIKARKEYFDILENEYQNQVPVLVSHGAVTGIAFNGQHFGSLDRNFFCNDDINFYDDELCLIARTGGLFAIQLDGNRLAPKKILRKSIFNVNQPDSYKHSALIIWRQIQHIAEVLDRQNLFAWGITAIGSDFDGTINPLKGIWTSEQMPLLADQLLLLADKYLKGANRLIHSENKNITPEEIVENFTIGNTLKFLERYYH